MPPCLAIGAARRSAPLRKSTVLVTTSSRTKPAVDRAIFDARSTAVTVLRPHRGKRIGHAFDFELDHIGTERR
jgi:hypothetical protein